MAKANRSLTTWIRNHLPLIILAVIFVGAAVLRFYKLDVLPPGLHPDEAANGQDIIHRIFNGDIRPIYNTNGPRESLFFFFQAFFVAVMGNTILALRMAPAVFGTLAVVVTYFWVKSWFGRRTAMIAAFFMAVNPWAIDMSRLGFRASMTPLMVTLTLLLLTLGFKKRKNLYFVLAGISLGLGFYTYLAFKMFPLALIAILIYMWIWRRDTVRPFIRPILWTIAAFCVVFSWQLAFSIAHPGDAGGRVLGTTFLNPELNHGHPIGTFIDGVTKTALQFNVKGDDNYRHNLGGAPALNVFVGVMFLLGLLITLVNLGRLRYFALLMVWGAMLAPEFLTAESLPHFLRAVGAIPATMALAAIGTSYMITRWYITFPVNSAARASGLSVILLLFALTAYQGYHQYFVAWARSPETPDAFSADSVAMAYFINDPKNKDATHYLLLDGYSDKTVDYLTYKHSTYTRFDSSSDVDKVTAPGKKQFIISKPYKTDAIKALRKKYPDGRLSTHYSDSNYFDQELYDVYEVAK